MSDAMISLFARRDDGFGACTVCKRRSAEGEHGMCRACAWVSEYKIADVTVRQVAHATKLLKSPGEMLKWPWPSLHTLAGPMMMGSVNYVVAASGIGKTTFVMDAVRRWVRSGIGVTVLPLETSAREFRLGLASLDCGLTHGEVYDALLALAEGDTAMDPILREVELMAATQATDPNMVRRLHVADDQMVTVDTLDRAFAVAVAMGHKVVIVDHIDHVSSEPDPVTGRAAQGIEGVREVNNALLALAKYHNIVVLAMSQANQSIMGDGSNPLLRYQRPQQQHIMYNSFKFPNASQILGIFRPLRPNVDRETFRLAREGVLDPTLVLAEGRMGLNMLKLRHRGKHEQRTLELIYDHGTLSDVPEHVLVAEAAMRSVTGGLSHASPVLTKRGK